jgi:diacylglycerol kinase family enzyme
MALQRLALIVNPKAGSRHAATFEPACELLRCHISTEILATERPGHATELARMLGADPDCCVAVCGGDGTILEALNGLPATGVLGILPGGTANVIARELGIPLNLREAAKVLLAGAPARIDTGTISWEEPAPPPLAFSARSAKSWFARHKQVHFSANRQSRFLMVAGFGFDAHVAGNVRALPKKILGQYAYHLETIRRFLGYQKPIITVSVDGADPITGQFALLANMRRYGGGLFFAHNARHDDGEMDLRLFPQLTARCLIKSAWEAHQRRGVPEDLAQRARGRVFDFFFDRPTPFQLDGEVFPGVTRARVETVAGGVRIVVP